MRRVIGLAMGPAMRRAMNWALLAALSGGACSLPATAQAQVQTQVPAQVPAQAPVQVQTQTPSPPETEDGRFVFHRSGDDYVRLDARTGQVSLCSAEPAGWACRAVPEERAALEQEIARLEQENGRLKKELLARGQPLPGMAGENIPQAPGTDKKDQSGTTLKLKLPSKSDLEQVLAFLEQTWLSLADAMSTLQREYFDRPSGKQP